MVVIPIEDVLNKKEKAILVGVELKSKIKRENEIPIEISLEELKNLSEAAGAEVVKTYFQKRDSIDNTYYIGKGIVDEIAKDIDNLEVDLVIFDTELSGSKQRNLEKRLSCKVIDRTTVILDIFARRAKSREGKLQVELAQMQYILPRLVGSNEELSRQAGGIGSKGPGETKLEQDRRVIRKRITDIKEELKKVEKQRKVLQLGRQEGYPLIALVGYTNAGKSTLRHRILEDVPEKSVNWENEDAGTNQLFATLDPTVRGIVLPSGKKALLADTVGFIQKLPHQLISAFKSTLNEVQNADLLLHVVDINDPNYELQIDAVNTVLKELNVYDKETIIIYNKADLVGEYLTPVVGEKNITVSAKDGIGIVELLNLIEKHLLNGYENVTLAIPQKEAHLISELYKNSQVKNITYEEDYIQVNCLLEHGYYSKYKEYIL